MTDDLIKRARAVLTPEMRDELLMLRSRLERVALTADIASHYIQDMRVMPAEGVARVAWDAMDFLDNLQKHTREVALQHLSDSGQAADRIAALEAEVSRLREALDASQSADPVAKPDSRQPVAVKVKPLAWGYEGNKSQYHADRYLVQEFFGSDQYYFETWDLSLGQVLYDGDDLPSAKAAAQADYEARILSTLDVQPGFTADDLLLSWEAGWSEALHGVANIAADIACRQRPDGFPEAASNAYHSGAMDVADAIRALTPPADLLDQVKEGK